MGKALEILRTHVSEATEQVVALLDRLSPADDPPYAAYQALAYLLERGVADAKVVNSFREFASVERAAGFWGTRSSPNMLCSRSVSYPHLLMSLVRRALRSSTPICVGEMASLWAAIGRPWCVRELVSALEEAPGASSIAEALRRCSSELASRYATKLYSPPTHDPSRLGYTPDILSSRGSLPASWAVCCREAEPLGLNRPPVLPSPGRRLRRTTARGPAPQRAYHEALSPT
jgi:hypothetical protein